MLLHFKYKFAVVALFSHSLTLTHTVHMISASFVLHFKKRKKNRIHEMFVEVYSIFVFNVHSSISSFFMSVVGKCVLMTFVNDKE